MHTQNPPDVVYIFSNINMPGMSELDMLKKVKAEFPFIKVSMISAYGDSENYNRALSSGATLFFTKPIDFDNLKAEILNHLLKY